MNAVVEYVRSLWVPLDGINLLVPNVAIAEVINFQPLEMIQEGPNWLLGSLRWRELELPVISMEALCGFGPTQAERGARISILNSVRAESGLSFYAMVTSDIPRLIQADAEALGDSIMGSREFPDTVADCVQIGNEAAVIPDLARVQALVESNWNALRG
jgi:chemosensory pili system protein ChpC